MDAIHFARAAVDKPGWRTEDSTIDLDALFAHIVIAIDAAVAAERARCAAVAWAVYHANQDRPGVSEYSHGKREAALHIARRIETGRE